MPLLALEPTVFPDNLFTEGLHEGEWFVLHTRPRAEKSLARRLLARNLGFFLPLYEHCTRSQGRVRSSYLPLFPSYLFLKGDRAARLQALETNLVVHCLSVADQGELHEDLTRVHQAQQSDSELAPEARLKPGAQVEVIDGSLAGLQGKVLRRGKQLRLVIEVRLLQQGVSVDIEHWMIRPLHSAHKPDKP